MTGTLSWVTGAPKHVCADPAALAAAAFTTTGDLVEVLRHRGEGVAADLAAELTSTQQSYDADTADV